MSLKHNSRAARSVWSVQLERRKKTSITFNYSSAAVSFWPFLQVFWIKTGNQRSRMRANGLSQAAERPLRPCTCCSAVKNHLTLSTSVRQGQGSVWAGPVKGQAIWMLLKTLEFLCSPYRSQSHQVISKRSSKFKMCRCFRLNIGICLCTHALRSRKKKRPQRTSDGFYGAVSARALSSVIVLWKVMRKLVTSRAPCRWNPQHAILHSVCRMHRYLFDLSWRSHGAAFMGQTWTAKSHSFCLKTHIQVYKSTKESIAPMKLFWVGTALSLYWHLSF